MIGSVTITTDAVASKMHIPFDKPTIVMWLPTLGETQVLNPKFPPYDFTVNRARDFVVWLRGDIVGKTTTFEAAMAVVRLFDGETFDYIKTNQEL